MRGNLIQRGPEKRLGKEARGCQRELVALLCGSREFAGGCHLIVLFQAGIKLKRSNQVASI